MLRFRLTRAQVHAVVSNWWQNEPRESLVVTKYNQITLQLIYKPDANVQIQVRAVWK